MEYLAFHFSKPYIPELVCDGGMWGIELTNSEGKKFVYVGSLVDDIVIGGLKISQIARKVNRKGASSAVRSCDYCGCGILPAASECSRQAGALAGSLVPDGER